MENNVDENTAEKLETTVEKPDSSDEKTYTRADIDASFNAGVKKANSDWNKSDEYKAFKNWQENQKTEAEKLSAERAEAEKLKKENASMKAEKKAAKAQAKPEFAEFVAEKVLAMEGDFDANLAEYKKSHPQYFGESAVRKIRSSPSMSGSNDSARTEADIMNALIRGN